jgi:AbrB family looped-hinge helix DNA binding protein
MTGRVGPKGQVVIPKPMRDHLGLRAGDEVEFELEGLSVRVHPTRPRGSVAGTLSALDLVGALEDEHRAELD